MLVVVSLISLVAAWGGEPCKNGQAGICQSTSSACNGRFLTGFCPGPSTNKCCAPNGGGSDTGNNNNPPPVIGSGGGTFPVAFGSLSQISVNWGGSRSGGTRCHAGIDLYTKSGGSIVAIASGTVTAVLRNWYTCSGGSIDAILVYHTSGPVAGKTVNYAEVSPGSYSVGVGSSVSAGSRLGSATRCGMLHMELYSGRQSSTQRWYPRGSIGNAFNGCATRWLSTKPAALQDPRPLVRSLMPAGASFRGGTSFLNDDSDASLAAEEDATQDVPPDVDPTDETSNNTGAIVASVVVGVVLLACVAGVVVFLVLRRRAAAGDVVVSNDFYAAGMASARDAAADGGTLSGAPAYATTLVTAPAAVGQYACQACGKAYAYEADLTQHVALRHAS